MGGIGGRGRGCGEGVAEAQTSDAVPSPNAGPPSSGHLPRARLLIPSRFLTAPGPAEGPRGPNTSRRDFFTTRGSGGPPTSAAKRRGDWLRGAKTSTANRPFIADDSFRGAIADLSLMYRRCQGAVPPP